jgi:hypothetical protein
MDQGNGVAELYNNQSVTEGLWHNITAVLRPDRYSYSRTANRIQSFCIRRCKNSFFKITSFIYDKSFLRAQPGGGGSWVYRVCSILCSALSQASCQSSDDKMGQFAFRGSGGHVGLIICEKPPAEAALAIAAAAKCQEVVALRHAV